MKDISSGVADDVFLSFQRFVSPISNSPYLICHPFHSPLALDEWHSATINEFQAAIGRFVLAWADMEVSLDLLALSIRLINAPDKRTPKLHCQLKAKKKFIRDETKKHPSLGTHQVVINDLLAEIESLCDTRHDFVHGAVIDHHLSRSGITVTMARLLQPPNAPRRDPVKVTSDKIEKTSNRIHTLSERLLDQVEAVNVELPQPSQ